MIKLGKKVISLKIILPPDKLGAQWPHDVTAGLTHMPILCLCYHHGLRSESAHCPGDYREKYSLKPDLGSDQEDLGARAAGKRKVADG